MFRKGLIAMEGKDRDGDTVFDVVMWCLQLYSCNEGSEMVFVVLCGDSGPIHAILCGCACVYVCVCVCVSVKVCVYQSTSGLEYQRLSISSRVRSNCT